MVGRSPLKGKKWKVYRCVEPDCNITVYRKDERCWKCWLKWRDAKLKKYQK